jgi:hypothetical protein
MPDPVSRLEVVMREIDRVFGDGYAAAHSDVVAAVVTSAAIDYAAGVIAGALLVEEEAQRIVSARELMRARP